MTKQTKFDYFIFYGNEFYEDGYIEESFNSVEEAEKFMEDDEFTSFKGVNVSDEHYFNCYFFYNDWSDYEDEDEYYFTRFASLEDALLYQESNNSGGHYQFVKSEEWVKGKGLINTILHDENLYPNKM